MDGETRRDGRGLGRLAVLLGLFAVAVWGDLIAQDPLEWTIRKEAGDGVRLDWRGGAGPFVVEYRNAVDGDGWRPVAPWDRWPADVRTVVDGLGSDRRFYRVLDGVPVAERGRLLGVEEVEFLSGAVLRFVVALGGWEGVPVDHDVRVYRVTYETVDAWGIRTVASGGMYLPVVDSGSSLSVVSYQHGTVFLRDEVPSRFSLENIETVGLALLASNGYFVVAPDYLGLGDSPGLHPYVLATPGATVVVDLLRAARAWAGGGAGRPGMGNDLFLTGYSEGGYVTMAAHREIEERHEGEFSVTASAPGAGPYDLSGTMGPVMLSDEPYGNAEYLALALVSYQRVYGMPATAEAVFADGIGEAVMPLMDGNHSGGEIRAVLPERPRRMMSPDLVRAVESDPNHWVWELFRANDLLDWVPRAPVRMYHCAGDTTVPKANSEAALAAFLLAGAEDVVLVDPAEAADHGGCVLPAFLDILGWLAGWDGGG